MGNTTKSIGLCHRQYSPVWAEKDWRGRRTPQAERGESYDFHRAVDRSEQYCCKSAIRQGAERAVTQPASRASSRPLARLPARTERSDPRTPLSILRSALQRLRYPIRSRSDIRKLSWLEAAP